MGKKKNLHPADIERRKAAKKNVERNRKIRQTQRETVLHSRSSVQLREEIHKMERLEKLGQGDDHGRARLKKLKQALDEALVREAAKAEEDKKKLETPDIVIKGLNKIVRRAAPTQDDMEDTQRTENDTSTNTTSQDMEPDDDMIIPEHIIKSTQAPSETSTSTAPSISTPAAPPPPPTPLLDLPPGLRIPPVGYVMDYLTPVAVGRGRGLPPAPGPGPAPVPFHHAAFPHPVPVPGMPLPMHGFPPPPAGRGIMMGRGQPVPVALPGPPPPQPASRPPPPQPAPFTHHPHPHPHPHGPPPPAPPPVPSPAGEEHVPMWKRAAMAEQQARRDKGRKGQGQGQGQGQGRHGHSNKPWSSDELDPMDPNPETAHEAYRGRGRGPPPPPSSSGPYVPAPPPPLSAAGISGAQIRAEMAAAGTLPPSSKSDSSSSSLSTSTSTPAVATVTAPPSKALPTVSLGAAASFLPSSLLVKRSAPAAAVPPDVLRKRARTNIAPDVAGAGTGAATPAPAPSSAAPPPPPPRKPASSVAAYDSFMRELEGLM